MYLVMYSNVTGSSTVSLWLWHSTRALLIKILASAVNPLNTNGTNRLEFSCTEGYTSVIWYVKVHKRFQVWFFCRNTRFYIHVQTHTHIRDVKSYLDNGAVNKKDDNNMNLPYYTNSVSWQLTIKFCTMHTGTFYFLFFQVNFTFQYFYWIPNVFGHWF